MSRRAIWARLTRLENRAEGAVSPPPCRVIFGDPTADDLASGLELIRLRTVCARVHSTPEDRAVCPTCGSAEGLEACPGTQTVQ